MKKRITFVKIITIFIVVGLSVVILSYNDSLRVPSIFDGKFYTTAYIPPAEHPFDIPENQIALPELSGWTDSAIASEYQYPDFLFQNTSTTSFLVVRNDTIIFKRYMNGVKEGENTQLFSVTKP